MAPFNPTQVWWVGFTFEDNNGNVAVTSLYYPAANSYAEVSDDAAALGALMEAASNARLTSIRIMATRRNADVSAPPPESEVERKLSITMGSADYPASTRLELPSPIFEMEQPRTDAVDPTNAVWLALQAGLVGTVLDPGGAASDSRGEQLTQVSRAVFTHRNRKPRT